MRVFVIATQMHVRVFVPATHMQLRDFVPATHMQLRDFVPTKHMQLHLFVSIDHVLAVKLIYFLVRQWCNFNTTCITYFIIFINLIFERFVL